VLADMVAQVAGGLPSVVSIVTGLLTRSSPACPGEDNKTRIATGLAMFGSGVHARRSGSDLVDAGLDIMTELVTQIAANADTTAPKNHQGHQRYAAGDR
jgi:hypothetical protein